jgi:hypothetical protein
MTGSTPHGPPTRFWLHHGCGGICGRTTPFPGTTFPFSRFWQHLFFFWFRLPHWYRRTRAAVTSWREYFEAQAGLFFGASAAWWLLAIGNSWLLLGVPLTSPTRLIYVAVLGGFLYATFWPSRRLHAALAIIVWVSVFPVMGTFFLTPDRVGVMP